MKAVTSLVLVVAAGVIAACGGSTSSTSDPNANTGNTNPGGSSTSAGPAAPTPPPAPDHGAPSEKYPAFAPQVGQVVDNGGPVLTNPVITTVTWPNDPNADKFEQFGDEVGPTAFWKATTNEYGVSAATSGSDHHVRLTTDAPASISDSDLAAFVAKNVGDPMSGWPAPNGQDIYILYLSANTSLQLQGSDACSQGVGGYHDSTTVNGKDVAFAIVPQCGGTASFSDTTLSASHELVEASTDPYPQTNPAYVGFDSNDIAWDFFQQFQSELGDACEFYRDSTMGSTTDFPFTVQRQWSNASAKAGHDPCVPAAHGTYFNVTPLAMEDITLDLTAVGGGPKEKAKGYTVPIGQTKTIPLGFYSDAAMDSWSIKAIEGGALGTSQKGRLTLTLDVTSGKNGQKAYLTVKANIQGKTKGELLSIVSTSNGVNHYMPIMISSPM